MLVNSDVKTARIRAVDLREAVTLYEAGHTIAEVAATLQVAPRTVVRNFDKAGIPRRRPGPSPRDVPVAEIQRLRDEGLTMPEVRPPWVPQSTSPGSATAVSRSAATVELRSPPAGKAANSAGGKPCSSTR
jgi:hypothetical protein